METITQQTTEQLEYAWTLLQSLAPVSVIRTRQQYDQALTILHHLLDLFGHDETHPLYDLLDTLAVLIYAYEESHAPVANVSGIDVLKLLMDEHQLTAADLPELGTPADVAGLLAGHQSLSVAHRQALAQRFGVSPATFV